MLIKRRAALAAAGTLAAALPLRKSRAATLEGPDALKPTTPPKPVPAISFQAADGATKTLADWKGQGVVLNVWATWCMPCVAEMPELAGLAGKLRDAKPVIAAPSASADHGWAERVKQVFRNAWVTWCTSCAAEKPAPAGLSGKPAGSAFTIAVLPVSTDHGGADKVKQFFAQTGIRDLPILADPGNALTTALGLRGIPTTLIIGPDGLERARAEGPVDWTSDAVIARIRQLIA